MIPLDDALSIRRRRAANGDGAYISSIVLALILTACHAPTKYVEQAGQVTLVAHRFLSSIATRWDPGRSPREGQEEAAAWLHLKIGRSILYHPHRLFRSMVERTLLVTVANHEQLPPQYRQWPA